MQNCHRTAALLASAAMAALLAASTYAAEDIFAINVEREKQLMDGHLKEAGDLLDANKLQQARATLRLVEDRLTAAKKSLSKPERQDFEARHKAIAGRMRAKEDSLVAVAKAKVASEGMDAAMDYSQTVLRRLGLPEERFQEIDQYLLEEAPRLQQQKESDAIERATKALEQGKAVPDDIDPYLAMTARQMVQARRDSLRAVKEQEREQARSAEEAKREKEAAREAAAERKKTDARERDSLAAQEKDRAAAERRARDEAARVQREQAEQQKLAEKKQRDALDQERREQEAAAREQREQEALAQKKEAEEQLAAVAQERGAQQKAAKRKEQEEARQQREKEALARKQEAERQLAAARREREAAEFAQREHEARLAAEASEETELRQRQAAEERTRSEQRAETAPEPGKPVKADAIPDVALAVQTRQPDVNDLAREREAAEKAQAAEAQEREKRVEEKRQEEDRVVALERFNKGLTTFQETEQAAGTTASVREYMRQRKEEETRAQSVAVQIYELMERKKPAEALSLFRGKRDYLAQYLSKEVFVVLEQSVVSAVPSAGPQVAGAGTAVTKGAPPPRELPKEEQYVMRIRAYLSERKWEPAISLFDATKKSLKAYMPKEEFDKLKGMVESGRKYAKQK